MSNTSLFRTENFRLTVLLSLLFVAASVSLTVYMYRETDVSLNASFLQEVRSDIAAVEDVYLNQGRSEAKEVVEQLTPAVRTSNTTKQNNFYLLQDKTGQKIAGNLPSMAPVFGTASLPPPAGTPNAAEHLIVGEGRSLPDGTYLFVGADSHWLIETHEHMLWAFSTTTALVIMVTVALGLALSQGTVRRIDQIIAVCRAIADNQWDKRVPLDNSRTDTAVLAVTINSMLDRIAALMETLRQVSTDIAHDLRTPLTHMRQRLERAQDTARTVEDYRAAHERAIKDSEELLSIFSALLDLSQIEAGGPQIVFKDVDLSELLAYLADFYRPTVEDNGQTLVTDIAPGVSIQGDRPLLMQMFSNLLENAVRYGTKGGRIGIDLRKDGQSAVASVTDNGPGIPAADHPRAFLRFWRGEASRNTPGHGLGLPLVAAIATLHKIEITLGDNAPGLAVRLVMENA